MTENKSNKEYDFKLQLQDGLEAEESFRRILLSKDTTFEVKAESNLWHDKGNIVVEYESYGKPSGIAATKADYWVHILRSKDKEPLAYLMFPTPILRKICNDVMKDGVYARTGGENSAMRMLLLNLKSLLSRLQNLSAKGDKVFTGWQPRKNEVYNVRGYQTRDYDQVKELYMNGSLYGGQFDPARDSKEKLASIIHDDPEAILVCESWDEIIGTVSLVKDGRVAWLFRFAVVDSGLDDENLSIRQRLYQRACSILKERGHTQVLVYAPIENEDLEKHYKALGMNKGNAYTCFWQELD